MKIIRRTSEFQAYLDRQTPERVREILAAERAHAEAQFERGTIREASEAQFAEDLAIRVPIEGGDTVERMLDSMGES